MESDRIFERLVANEERAKSNTKRLDEHDKEIENLKKTYSIMEKMDYRMGEVEKSVSRIDKKLDGKIDGDEKKKIDWFDYILKGIATIILGYVAIKLGLK